MWTDEEAAIVFDSSSSKTTKAGFAGDDGPRAVFPSVTGRERHQGVICFGKNVKDVYVGHEVQEKNSRYNHLVANHPMEDGLVTNWLDMEKIWHHAYYDQLKVDPEAHPLLITDRFLPPAVGDNRAMMTQIVFETFLVPAFYPVYAEISSMYMYASGTDTPTNTAIRIHSNDISTTIVPVMRGIAMPHASRRLERGGRDVTSSLRIQRLFCETGNDLPDEIAQDIKHKLSYVALDPETECDPNTPWIEQPYKLPDGKMISIGKERYMAPEEIFTTFSRPTGDIMFPALQDAIVEAISKCDKSFRSELRGNIILSGGNTRFPGYQERLARELGKTTPPEDWLPEWKVNVTNRADEKDAAWIGGSILASLSTFQNIWIAKEEYDEFGPIIVRRKTLA